MVLSTLNVKSPDSSHVAEGRSGKVENGSLAMVCQCITRDSPQEIARLDNRLCCDDDQCRSQQARSVGDCKADGYQKQQQNEEQQNLEWRHKSGDKTHDAEPKGGISHEGAFDFAGRQGSKQQRRS